ncbi:MAG: hypothetical protein RLZZ262_687 [Bacteroidota bacterium]
MVFAPAVRVQRMVIGTFSAEGGTPCLASPLAFDDTGWFCYRRYTMLNIRHTLKPNTHL